MNKKSVLSILALAPAVASHSYAESPGNNAGNQTDNHPNIILFMVDDMGWQDTSLPFWNQQTKYNRLYETPNMERLAKQGK